MSESSKYSKLLSPLDLGPFSIKNRVIMGSMHTGLEEESGGMERMASYFGDRAKGGVGLIVTGGIAPSRQGWLSPFGAKMSTKKESRHHRIITEAVHAENSKIVMQILHGGRYSYHPFAVAPSRIKSPISPFKPWALTKLGIIKTMRDFVRSAKLAKEAGYDGVEIMGSEGYLINQFISARTNKRTDSFGGSFENRIRFPIELVKRVREEVGEDFLIIYRLSMIDLVENGSVIDEVVHLGLELEKVGVNVFNTGIGWHEARIPTIATPVPRQAFSWVTAIAKQRLNIPLITSNRINDPAVAEKILVDGDADLISMARPLLADAEFVNKAAAGKPESINTCIACNQACLDHIFERKVVSCLVNPYACVESEMKSETAERKLNVAVVGAGVAGLACATEAAARGHSVTLYEKSSVIGGQFILASRIPGKEEFVETLRYYKNRIEETGVNLVLGTSATLEELEGFDDVVIATGVNPREVHFSGTSNNSKILNYPDVIMGKVKVGKKVAVIGAGGIGFDVSEFLLHEGGDLSTNNDSFRKYWGIDNTLTSKGAIDGIDREISAPKREIFLLQRKTTRHGKNLGKTTGWIHRQMLKDGRVKMLGGVEYLEVNDEGLKIQIDGEEKILDVDHIVICAGQVSETTIWDQLKDKMGDHVHLIGGANLAAELDAKRAIKEGTAVALIL
jgi:2,4-dienoyl-CoA reductase (NADPH2)